MVLQEKEVERDEEHIGKLIKNKPLKIKGAYNLHTSQWAFTSSKLTIETLEQGVKYVQS